MAHRHATRSKTPTAVIDLTQEIPRRRVRAKHHVAALQVPDPHTASEQRENQELIVLKESGQVPKNRKVSEDKASNLPCIDTSITGTPELLICAVCFGAMSATREPMATRCGHVFCKECLTTSLRNRKRCPTCQTIAHISKCIRLYFS